MKPLFAAVILGLSFASPGLAQDGGIVCAPLSDADAQRYVKDGSQTLVKDSGVICRKNGAVTQARIRVKEPNGDIRDCEVRTDGGQAICWRAM